jgi:hypothetical protein
VSIEALAELAEAAELLRGERDWFRWTEESDIPDAYIAAASPDVVLALVRVALAAKDHGRMFHDCDCTWHVALRDALADLDR